MSELPAVDSRIIDKSLIAKLQTVIDYSKTEVLRFWQRHEPHFTDHGESHCEGIYDLINRMIPLEARDNFNQYEIFLLLCGVWLHDIGMIVDDEQVREKHHELGRDFIRTRLGDLGLGEMEKYVIGELAYYHRKKVNINDVKKKIPITYNSKTYDVQLRLLCAILRLGDACEISHSRSSKGFSEVGGLNPIAKFHHEAHLHVSGVNFDHITNKIIVNMIVNDEEDKLILTNYFKSNLEEELLSIKGVLDSNILYFDGIECEVILDEYSKKITKNPITNENIIFEERLLNLKEKIGYTPNMSLLQNNFLYFSYSTISSTSKELQLEILNIVIEIWKYFFNVDNIMICVNKPHNYTNTIGDVDPEIICLYLNKNNYLEYESNKINKKDYWNKIVFLKKIQLDQFHKARKPIKWELRV